MQTSVQQMVNHEQVSSLSQEFAQMMNEKKEESENDNASYNSCESEDEDEDEEEDGEFSFMCGDLSSSPIAAEDAFINGQIKPVYPFFNQEFNIKAQDLPFQANVNKVFVETERRNSDKRSHAPGNDDVVVGPCCEWSNRKAVEVDAREGCKKSNSTGFSKIWRFKEFMNRSNSDGRDAYVYLNNAPAQAQASTPVHAPVEVKEKAKTKKTSKASTKKAAVSSHEAYLKSKVKDNRRRSYLPYRPELMGFFTNVNSGLSKNVHPY